MVSASVTNAGIHVFVCSVTLELTLVPDVIQDSVMTNITVQGEELNKDSVAN